MAMQLARVSMIAYACAPGQTAADGSGRSGVFTKHLLEHPGTPRLDLNKMFVCIGIGVERGTNKKQSPHVNSALRVERPTLW